MHVADWRCAASYARQQDYDRAGLAWEIVRRSDAYGRDYDRLKSLVTAGPAEMDGFAQRWGLSFGANPHLDFDQQPVVWLPQVWPSVLYAQPACTELAFDPLDVSALLHDPEAVVQRLGDDLIVSRRGVHHQLRLDHYDDGAMALVLPLDRLFASRLASARRFWRELCDLPPGPEPLPLSLYARRQLVLVIRLIDAKQSGAGEREMAAVVLGFAAPSRREWTGCEGRSRLKRLLRQGHVLMAGGYRNLLSPPPRRRRGRN